MLGIMIATIGTDGATGMPRFTFGNISLLSGVLLVPWSSACSDSARSCR